MKKLILKWVLWYCKGSIDDLIKESIHKAYIKYQDQYINKESILIKNQLNEKLRPMYDMYDDMINTCQKERNLFKNYRQGLVSTIEEHIKKSETIDKIVESLNRKQLKV